MKLDIRKVWEVHTTTNEWGAPGKRLGICETPVKADALAEGRGWWGGKGRVTETHAIFVDGKVYLLADPEPITLESIREKQKARDEELCKTAVEKLTPAEARALGLHKKPNRRRAEGRK